MFCWAVSAVDTSCGPFAHQVGFAAYDTPAKLLLLNKIWTLQSKLTNYFYPQQTFVSKVRDGANVTKKYDTTTTPHRRATTHDAVTDETRSALDARFATINPAAVQRQIQALTTELITLATSKQSPSAKPSPGAPDTRASSGEATKRATWAS